MRLPVTLALAAVTAPTLAFAQNAATAAPRFGILAGLNSTTFGGKDANSALSETNASISPDRRNGFIGGAYITLPIGASPVAIRPELLYAMKGAQYSESGMSLKLKLNYVEVPVLLQVATPATAGLRPAFYVGPSFSFRSSCRAELSGGGESLSTDCAGNQTADVDPGIKSFDVGGVVGGQIGFGLGGQSVGLGVRYTQGFSDVTKYASVKNRALSVYCNIEFPLGSRR